MELYSINDLRQAAMAEKLSARVHLQVGTLEKKEARNGKPFWELIGADAGSRLTLRAWNDEPAFAQCEALQSGAFIEVAGEFSHNGSFGLEARGWDCRDLSLEERDALLAGPADVRQRQAADYAYIEAQTRAIADPRLAALTALFLHEYGDRFRRTAAARQNHHARRGGLVEHVAQMMRSAVAISGVYTFLNRDLMVAGVLFHDTGKLWENALPADGFQMPFDERGEMLGHITIGIELLNALWRKIMIRPESAEWARLTPSSEDVRLHLLHLIASHHGELQFGSPVVPKTPEAWALHYVDNLDAKLEMISMAYGGRQLAPRIWEKMWPLPGNTVAPLAVFTERAHDETG